MKSAWKNFGYKLEDAERDLRAMKYVGVFDFHPTTNRFFRDIPGISPEDVRSILNVNALAPPHGLDALTPPPLPKLPSLPELPAMSERKEYDNWKVEKFQKLKVQLEEVLSNLQARIDADSVQIGEIVQGYGRGDDHAIKQVVQINLGRHPLPKVLRYPSDFVLDREARIGLCTIEVPDFSRIPIVKQRGESWSAPWKAVSKKDAVAFSRSVVHGLCIRAAYLVARSDEGSHFDLVVINAMQKWFDPATGAPKHGVIASLQAKKEEISQIEPGRVEATACFRHFSGISTPNPCEAAAIRPIFVLDKNDERVVKARAIPEASSGEDNLASMPWEDFEHLVRQLFEWMFGENGVEVEITRASRDRGVDAIMFDPDPIRGGKYVVQAKRYTRTVDVAAVRDLYGTVVNEGANRGILVTTASYGPDAYEFAKDKPISLIDGPNLLALLMKHGRRYRIDLAEARLQNIEN